MQQSGLTYTILRPSYFMEVWLSPVVGFDFPNATAQLYGSGRNPISWISLGDVARFAVESLDHPNARNATLELGGPEALSPSEEDLILNTRLKSLLQHWASQSQCNPFGTEVMSLQLKLPDGRWKAGHIRPINPGRIK